MENVEYKFGPADLVHTYKSLHLLRAVVGRGSGGQISREDAQRFEASVSAILDSTRNLLRSDYGRARDAEDDEKAVCPFGLLEDGGFRYEVQFSDGWSVLWLLKPMNLVFGVRKPGYDRYRVEHFEFGSGGVEA